MGRKRAPKSKSKDSKERQQAEAGNSCDIAATLKSELDSISAEEDSQEVLFVKKKSKRSTPLVHEDSFRLDILNHNKQFSRIKLLSESEDSSISSNSARKKKNSFVAIAPHELNEEKLQNVESKLKNQCNESSGHLITDKKHEKRKVSLSKTPKVVLLNFPENRKYDLEKQHDLKVQEPQLVDKNNEYEHKKTQVIRNKTIKKKSHKRFNIKNFTKNPNKIKPTQELFGENEGKPSDFMLLSKYSKRYNCSFDPILCLKRIPNGFNESLDNDLVDFEDEIDIKDEPLINSTFSDQCKYSDTMRAKYESDDILLAPIKKESRSPIEVSITSNVLTTKQDLTPSHKILRRDYGRYRINRNSKSKYLYVPNTLIRRLTSHDPIFRNATLATIETFNLSFAAALATNLYENICTKSNTSDTSVNNTKPIVAEEKEKCVKLTIDNKDTQDTQQSANANKTNEILIKNDATKTNDSSINHSATVLNHTQSTEEIVTQLSDTISIPNNINENHAPNINENGIDDESSNCPNSIDLQNRINKKRFNYVKWSKKMDAIMDVVSRVYGHANSAELAKPDSSNIVPVVKECHENDVKLDKNETVVKTANSTRSESRLKDATPNHSKKNHKRTKSSGKDRPNSNHKSIESKKQNSSVSTMNSKQSHKKSKDDEKPITSTCTKSPNLCATFSDAIAKIPVITNLKSHKKSKGDEKKITSTCTEPPNLFATFSDASAKIPAITNLRSHKKSKGDEKPITSKCTEPPNLCATFSDASVKMPTVSNSKSHNKSKGGENPIASKCTEPPNLCAIFSDSSVKIPAVSNLKSHKKSKSDEKPITSKCTEPPNMCATFSDASIKIPDISNLRSHKKSKGDEKPIASKCNEPPNLCATFSDASVKIPTVSNLRSHKKSKGDEKAITSKCTEPPNLCATFSDASVKIPVVSNLRSHKKLKGDEKPLTSKCTEPPNLCATFSNGSVKIPEISNLRSHKKLKGDEKPIPSKSTEPPNLCATFSDASVKIPAVSNLRSHKKSKGDEKPITSKCTEPPNVCATFSDASVKIPEVSNLRSHKKSKGDEKLITSKCKEPPNLCLTFSDASVKVPAVSNLRSHKKSKGDEKPITSKCTEPPNLCATFNDANVKIPEISNLRSHKKLKRDEKPITSKCTEPQNLCATFSDASVKIPAISNLRSHKKLKGDEKPIPSKCTESPNLCATFSDASVKIPAITNLKSHKKSKSDEKPITSKCTEPPNFCATFNDLSVEIPAITNLKSHKKSIGDEKPITSTCTEAPNLCVTFNDSSEMPAITNLKRKYMDSPQSNTGSITPIPSESSFTLSPNKIGAAKINLNFDSIQNHAMPENIVETTSRCNSDTSMDPKRKHTFKFDNSVVKRPPTRKPIILNRPTVPISEFKVPPPVISLSVPKNVNPVCKPDDFDVISIYADTIANKSVCDNKSVRLSLSDDEDATDNSKSFEKIPIMKSNSNNVGIDVGSWVAQSLRVQNQLETNVYPTKIEGITPLSSTSIIAERDKIVAKQSLNEVEMNEPRYPVNPNMEHYRPINNPTTLRTFNEANTSNVLMTPPLISSCTRNNKKIIPAVFNQLCPNIKFYGKCKRVTCMFKHSFQQNWQKDLKALSVQDLMNLYSSIKVSNQLFLFKKIFPTIAEQLGLNKDYNHLVSLVKDVLTTKMNSDRTPFIKDIIKGLCTTGVTFHSTVELMYKNACVCKNLQNLLGDILLNITVENGNLDENWSVIQMLILHSDCSIDGGVIHNILCETFLETPTQKELCLKVYCDLILKLSDDTLCKITPQILRNYILILRKMNLNVESDNLSARVKFYLDAFIFEQNISPESGTSTHVAEPLLPCLEQTYLKPAPAINMGGKLIQSCPPLNILESQRSLHAKQAPPLMNPFKIPLMTSKSPNWHSKTRPVHNVAPANFTQPAELLNMPPISMVNFDATVPPPALPIRSPPVPQLMFSEEKVQQAVYNMNVGDMLALIMTYKDTHWTEDFLRTAIRSLLLNPNLTSFFTTLCQNAAVIGKDALHADKALQYIFKTLSMNLILHLAQVDKLQEAFFVHTTIVKLYNFSDDIINVKLYLKDNFSLTKRLLIISKIYYSKSEFKNAWNYLKEHALGTGPYWKLPEREDIEFKNEILCDFLASIIKQKQWTIGLTVMQYLLSNNFHEIELKQYLDQLLLLALNNGCPTENITNIINSTVEWYAHVSNNTFRAIIIKLFTNNYRTRVFSLYKTGVQLDIYPHINGDERIIEFQTHFLFDEVFLMIEIFLQNMINFIPINYSVEIRAKQSVVFQGADLPSIMYQPIPNPETMRARIVNILNNYIKPPLTVANINNTLIIDRKQLENHLEIRCRK